MNLTLNRTISISTLILCFLGIFFFYDQSGIYLILIFIFLSNESINYVINRNKLKAKTNFKIGKRKQAIWDSLFFFALGLFWIWLAYKEKSNFTHSVTGIWHYIFISIFTISISLFKNENFQIYLKDDSIVFFDFKKRKDWKISAIDKVIMSNNRIIILREGYKKEFHIDENANEIQILKEYFKNKLKERFEMNENTF